MSINHVESYLQKQKHLWAPTTWNMEYYRLKQFQTELNDYIDNDTDPMPAIAERISGMSPYTQKVSLVRIAHFLSKMTSKRNIVQEYLHDARRKYLGAYRPKRLQTDFKAVEAKLKAAEDKVFSAKALEILYSAQRYKESVQPYGDSVIAKGDKEVPDFRPRLGGNKYSKSYWTFLKQLKACTGLTCHGLRKLAITNLTDKGATPADLMRAAGWTSINTAYSYMQPKQDEKLKEMLWNK